METVNTIEINGKPFVSLDEFINLRQRLERAEGLIKEIKLDFETNYNISKRYHKVVVDWNVNKIGEYFNAKGKE